MDQQSTCELTGRELQNSDQMRSAKAEDETGQTRSDEKTRDGKTGSRSKERQFETDDHLKNMMGTVVLAGENIVSLFIDGIERLCLAQISNTILQDFSYNEIHNRRVALGITCAQCTPIQLEILRRAGAMPASSRRCGVISKREAERLVRSFLDDNSPPKLPLDTMFHVSHTCGWGAKGLFIASRYISSRAKCIRCEACNTFFSPNKFIFHFHRGTSSTYNHPDAANFNSWRRHLRLDENPVNDAKAHAWEDVKAMFNGGCRKRTSRDENKPMKSETTFKKTSVKKMRREGVESTGVNYRQMYQGHVGRSDAWEGHCASHSNRTCSQSQPASLSYIQGMASRLSPLPGSLSKQPFNSSRFLPPETIWANHLGLNSRLHSGPIEPRLDTNAYIDPYRPSPNITSPFRDAQINQPIIPVPRKYPTCRDTWDSVMNSLHSISTTVSRENTTDSLIDSCDEDEINVTDDIDDDNSFNDVIDVSEDNNNNDAMMLMLVDSKCSEKQRGKSFTADGVYQQLKIEPVKFEVGTSSLREQRPDIGNHSDRDPMVETPSSDRVHNKDRGATRRPDLLKVIIIRKFVCLSLTALLNT